MKYVKFCPHCANISYPAFTEDEFQELSNNNNMINFNDIKCKIYKIEIERERGYYSNICYDCKNNLKKTEITIEEYTNYIGYDYTIDKDYREPQNEDKYTEINKKILNEYIKPLNLLEVESEKYIENMLTFYGINLYPQPTYTPTPSGILMAQQMAKNKPKCPVCGSTDLKKLSVLDRGASVFMWGLGSNKIGKTYECRKCKSTF